MPSTQINAHTSRSRAKHSRGTWSKSIVHTNRSIVGRTLHTISSIWGQMLKGGGKQGAISQAKIRGDGALKKLG
eukprot:1155591-Pelagomonas_calceolata.AAC.1